MPKTKQWTCTEDRSVVAFAQAGSSIAEIAEIIGRSADAVQSRVCFLRQSLGNEVVPYRHKGRPAIQPSPGPARVNQGGRGEQRKRLCMCCGKTFLSAHSMNRLCTSCRTKDVSPFCPAT